jgi:hypothetical protein
MVTAPVLFTPFQTRWGRIALLTTLGTGTEAWLPVGVKASHTEDPGFSGLLSASGAVSSSRLAMNDGIRTRPGPYEGKRGDRHVHISPPRHRDSVAPRLRSAGSVRGARLGEVRGFHERGGRGVDADVGLQAPTSPRHIDPAALICRARSSARRDSLRRLCTGRHALAVR